MEQKRPSGRQKNVTGTGSVHRRGSGLGTGPVGNSHSSHSSSGGFSNGSSGYNGGSSNRNVGTRAAVGGGGGIVLLLVGFLLLKTCSGGGLSSLLGGGGSTLPSNNNSTSNNGYIAPSNAQVDTSVAAGSRAKYTSFVGNNQDEVTIMVYMCGTDLESKSGMASSDLQEMANASFGDNINLLVYTGGCKQWKINGISNKTQQIYQIKNGKLTKLVDNLGSKAMTSPDTLSNFIQYCADTFPANRNELILWDHGGGSVTGYGYDETQSSAGSMNLAGISKALKNGGVKFDFIGFDACLMATAENALMLNDYADYMIASEETEPGIGWYYTNWLTQFGKNTSMPTTSVGKIIVDDFISTCGSQCKGQKTTLSVIDLAEFSNTIPGKLNDFASDISTQLTNKKYQEVSEARQGAREFAQSSKIDQVDLVDLANNMNSSEGKALSKALKSAVKYNRTSTNMTDAYGVSIYFPYQKANKVDNAVSTYDQIGMDDAYSQCIRQFAKLETTGQIAGGSSSSSSPLGSLFDSSLLGSLIGGNSSGSISSDMVGSLLSSFMNAAGGKSISGLDDSNTAFMNDDTISLNDTTAYISSNYFDDSNLTWTQSSDGNFTMDLTDEQWNLVNDLNKNVFFDDGTGYVDLGMDNVFDIDKNTLIADAENTWVAINNQPVAYYHTDTVENNGVLINSGYVPALLNGERVNLMIVFEGTEGYIAGATTDYKNGETDTVAKSVTELKVGDKLDFLCDYYDYNCQYQDSYMLGEPMTVTNNMVVSDVVLDNGKSKITYCFTDIYNQKHWSDAIISK